MPILPRYFLKIFLPIFLVCLAMFLGVLLMNHFIKIFNMAVMRGISPLWIATCFARLLPFISSLALPMAFLVALLLTLGQLAEGGEIMALRASGFSFMEMTWPFLAVGVMLSGLLFYMNHKASPEGFHSFRNKYAQAAQQLARLDLEPRTFMKLGPWRLYSEKVDKKTGNMEGVYFLRQGRTQEDKGVRINALRGRMNIAKGKAVTLELEDGDILVPNPDPEKYSAGHFKRYRVEIPLAGFPLERSPDIQEMNSSRLRELIRDPATDLQHRLEYKVELAVRSAAALSPFVFFWIAVPLGLQPGRSKRGASFAFSLGILFVFYGLIAVGIALGRRHENLSYAAPWLSDITGLALGVLLTKRVAGR